MFPVRDLPYLSLRQQSPESISSHPTKAILQCRNCFLELLIVIFHYLYLWNTSPYLLFPISSVHSHSWSSWKWGLVSSSLHSMFLMLGPCLVRSRTWIIQVVTPVTVNLVPRRAHSIQSALLCHSCFSPRMFFNLPVTWFNPHMIIWAKRSATHLTH